MNYIKDVLSKLTLTEKASLCSGLDFWHTKEIKRLDVPGIAFCDGPHGLRKENNDDTENVGLKQSFPATSFPPAVNMASTWNTDLVYKVGETLADQCKNQDVDVILGPGTNIKRSPLCGRNFEYFSEDPFLAGKMCVEYIDGVQSKNVGTSLKHFAVNNQESMRMTINALVDERAFREIYLYPFEVAVKQSQPWTVMCSYNKVDGVYLSDNKRLLTDILRKEWGYNGLVVSDWNAVNNRVAGIKAGMDIEMPSCGGRTDKEIIEAVLKGELLESELDVVVERILEFVYRCYINKEAQWTDYDKAHELARKVAQESMVLLKNDAELLPLTKKSDIALIGALAETARYQGTGSSRINPYNLVSVKEGFDLAGVEYEYAEGYKLTDDGYDESMINAAVELAKSKETAVVCIGLTDSYESEGYDRSRIDLPRSHNVLVDRLLAANKNTVILLFGGSPVAMPWIDGAQTVINAYLPGEASGEAVTDVLFGDVNPSGKLAETYPVALEDYLPSLYYKGGPKNVEHRESIFVGYRYYDTAKKNVLFPFGYGLSYTKFELDDLKLSSAQFKTGKKVIASVLVTNVGKKDGAEVVQLYVRAKKSKLYRADKELKGFAKVYLKAGESATVNIVLDDRSFSYYNTDINNWHIEEGDYEILVGNSSRNISLTETLFVSTDDKSVEIKDMSGVFPTYYALDKAKEIPDGEWRLLYGKEIPPNMPTERGDFDHNVTMGELSSCFVGKVFMKLAPGVIKSQVPDADLTAMLMIQQGLVEMPLRALNGITSGLLDERVTKGLLLWGNKKRLKGLCYLLSGFVRSFGNIRRKNKMNKVKLSKLQNAAELNRIQEEHENELVRQKQVIAELKKQLKSIKVIKKDSANGKDSLEYIQYHEEKLRQSKDYLIDLKKEHEAAVEKLLERQKEKLREDKANEEKLLKEFKREIELMNDYEGIFSKFKGYKNDKKNGGGEDK